ncbi:hypothetical protein DL98DRAFT_594783 [Cadophora sp. DSE1049]|nr:hypothetical protein DL98DRAFT_594783 [Cadophora sp. DSE1049]
MVRVTSLLVGVTINILALSVGCYNTRIAWPDKGTGHYHAARACYGYEENGQRVQGRFENVYFYPSGQSPAPASVCINDYNSIVGDYSIFFQITNLTCIEGFTLRPDDYFAQLDAKIHCDRSGAFDVAGWTYR